MNDWPRATMVRASFDGPLDKCAVRAGGVCAPCVAVNSEGSENKKYSGVAGGHRISNLFI